MNDGVDSRTNGGLSAIESDDFPFEFLSRLAERESWRKEIHRPIYHIHKWWAKRLGSVFRGILIGCALPSGSDVADEFYRLHDFSGRTVFDPFMGSGTTVGEAHKLGFTALGRDINPVAADAVYTAFGRLDRREILLAFEELSERVGPRLREMYRSADSRDRPCDVLYFFWVMRAMCPRCHGDVDLFPSYVVAKNAYPNRKPEAQLLCPECGALFRGRFDDSNACCASCGYRFDPAAGQALRARATCGACDEQFSIIESLQQVSSPPRFRLYGKLVLTRDGAKEYLAATDDDLAAYEKCVHKLNCAVENGTIDVPSLALEDGYNTRQAMNYGFRRWRDFFNARQLLALGLLRRTIDQIDDGAARRAMLTAFSGALEFNNLFASYKGEGTGAVRHMFAHHVLKPQRTPIEANVWGTPKSSGSFANLVRNRLLRAIDYRESPTELRADSRQKALCSRPFAGVVEHDWPTHGNYAKGAVYLSAGDSGDSGLPAESIDVVVTDPPFFDNVHYSELADFFFAWQQLPKTKKGTATTRNRDEVQDTDAERFSAKLGKVFAECFRVLKPHGLLAFTYHHARSEGWEAVAGAVLAAGFFVVNAHPVCAEMAVAAPKSQAKEPIQFDMIIVCRKCDPARRCPPSLELSLASAREKIARLRRAGFKLSRNDRRIILFGQLLTTLRSVTELQLVSRIVDAELATSLPEEPVIEPRPQQTLLF